jgi:hypothetical protein
MRAKEDTVDSSRARIGLLACSLAALLMAQCGTDEGPGPTPAPVTITPDQADLTVSASQQFAATAGGDSVEVMWQVDGVLGGNPAKGLVTPGGLYVAPSALPSLGYVALVAKELADTTATDTVWIHITKPAGTTYVTVSPDTISAQPFSQIEFSSLVSDCFSGDVTWSVSRLWGSASSIGTVSPQGFYEAPGDVSTEFAVMIKATSTGCPDKAGIAMVRYHPSSWPDVELEDYTESYNEPGSIPITAPGCPGASGLKAVQGMDYPGEWIKVPVYVARAGEYQVLVAYQASAGDDIRVRVGIEGCGTPSPECDFVLDEGKGIG